MKFSVRNIMIDLILTYNFFIYKDTTQLVLAHVPKFRQPFPNANI